MHTAITSPRFRPSERSRCAPWFERSSSCRYVIVSPVAAMTIAGLSGWLRAWR